MRERLRSAVGWSVRTYVVFVVVGIVVGALLTPLVLDSGVRSDGTVAVVPIDGSIDGNQLTQYEEAMTRARAEADAVVLVVNSGGGSAAASEAMYLQTKRTSAEIPVVATVSAAAASGAYFAMVPAERIYVKPASLVGSIGVVANVPPTVEPNQLIGTTGPDKLAGASGRDFYYTLDTVQGAFLNAVFEHRGDHIRLSRSTVAEASTYAGVTAVENGLADDVGDRQAAIRAAAELAGLERPTVAVYGDGGEEHTFLLRSTYLASAADSKRLVDGEPFVARSDGLPTFLMVPAGTLAQGSGTIVASAGEGVRVVEGSPATPGNETQGADAAPGLVGVSLDG